MDRDEMLAAALAYASLGWYVFPAWGASEGRCRCGRDGCASGKHPQERLVPRGHLDATTDPDRIRAWWTTDPDAGIGVSLRPSGLVAIDIDPRNGGWGTMDALEAEHGPITSDVLQYTQSGGEHRIFALDPSSPARIPGSLGPGVDVKRNGYIVVAPTRGVLGEYAWEASSSPLDGAVPTPIPQWMLQGSSQQVTVCAPIRLATVDQLAELQDALQYIPADDYHTWVRVGMALSTIGAPGYELWDRWSSTSNKYRPAEMPGKWRSFRGGGVNLETVFYLAQQYGWRHSLAGPVIELPELHELPEPQSPPQPAEEPPVDIPVPVLMELVEWMERYAETPNRVISVQGALAVASVLAGRIYESENRNVSSLYLLVLAPTGAGKGYAKTAIRTLLAHAGLPGLLSGSGNTSAGAVFSALFRSPTHIQITDEYGKHLIAARRQQAGAMADALTVLTEAYSDATGILVPRNYSHFHLSKKELAALDTKTVYRPAITILALATQEQVCHGLTTAEIDDGFLNRFLVVDASSVGALPERRIRATDPPRALIEWARAVRRTGDRDISGTSMVGVDTDYDIAPTPVRVPIDPAAWGTFDAFRDTIRQGQWIEPRLTIRWRENAMRLATALAVAADPHAPRITQTLADWAVRYVHYHGAAFVRLAAAHIADSDYHRLYLAIRDAIEHAGPSGLTERELCRRCRLVERTPLHMRDQVLAALIRDEAIAKVRVKTKGRTREALVHGSYIRHHADHQTQNFRQHTC